MIIIEELQGGKFQLLAEPALMLENWEFPSQKRLAKENDFIRPSAYHLAKHGFCPTHVLPNGLNKDFMDIARLKETTSPSNKLVNASKDLGLKLQEEKEVSTI